MSRLRTFSTLGLLALGGLGSPAPRTASAQQYAVTDLGANTLPRAVNPAGQVAGGVSYTTTTNKVTTSYSRAFLWTPSVSNGTTGKTLVLGTLGGMSSNALGLRGDGTVIGRADTAQLTSSGTPVYHAFVWDATRGMRDLNTIFGPNGVSAAGLGWNLSGAIAINAGGQVVGEGTNPGWPGAWSFVWELDGLGNVHVRPTPLSDNVKYVIDRMGLNAAGQVAQYAYDASGYRRACVWSRDAAGNGTSAFLPFLASGTHSEATDINNPAYDSLGNLTRPAQVVGFSTTYYLNGPFRAFVWDAQNGIKDLGTLGGTTTIAYGINDASQVVGRSSDSSAPYVAFLWDPVSGIRNLSKISDVGTVWSLSDAIAISNAPAAQIVGPGKLSGANHGFLLTPK